MAKVIRTDGTEQALADASLESLQKAVGGYIEHVVMADGRDGWINEEGKLQGLRVNMKATTLWLGRLAVYPDVLCGDVVITEPGEVD